jgi:uncharacterized membrane protein YqjE
MAIEDRSFRRDGPPRVNDPMPRDPIPVPRTPMRTPADDRSLGELFSELATELRTLVRQEVTLAKVEVQDKASKASRNVGLMVGGGLIAYVGVFAVVAAVILLLGSVIPDWLSALIVGLVVIGTGYALLQSGRKGLKQTNFSLERTAETLQEDKQWLKEEVKDLR